MIDEKLVPLLMALADDELVLGYRDSEWTGIAPLLEEDVALSSMAQDEIGHARMFYEMVSGILDKSPDSIALGREPSGFHHCRLVERPRGDWAYSMARQFLYDAADGVRLEMLTRSTHKPLALGVAKVIREEKYHRMHGESWIGKLAHGTDESHRRLEAALLQLWPDLPGFFEPVEGEAELVKAGVLPEPFSALLPRWWQVVEPVLARHGLHGPNLGLNAFSDHSGYGGREGRHSEDFVKLWNEMTLVYGVDPEAVW